MSLRNRAQVGSSVAATKLNTVDDARARIVAGLKGQKEVWDKDKGASLPERKPKGQGAGLTSKSSLWFKKKELNEDWLLKIKLSQTSLYMTEEARKARNPYFTVKESEMSQIMDDTMEEVRKGEWDKEIKDAMSQSKKAILG